MRAAPSCAKVRTAAGSSRVTAATSTPGKTATPTAGRTARGRSTDNGGWSNTDRQPSADRATPSDRSAGDRPTTTDRSTVDQLNRDAAARSQGSQRTRDSSTYRSAPSTPRNMGGSYGGGRSRGGGGGGRRR